MFGQNCVKWIFEMEILSGQEPLTLAASYVVLQLGRQFTFQGLVELKGFKGS